MVESPSGKGKNQQLKLDEKYLFRRDQTKHWSENHQFGSRAVFRTSVSPAQLILTNVDKSDTGKYRCRIDFRQVKIH